MFRQASAPADLGGSYSRAGLALQAAEVEAWRTLCQTVRDRLHADSDEQGLAQTHAAMVDLAGAFLDERSRLDAETGGTYGLRLSSRWDAALPDYAID